eukprot:CAMPEP_0113313614 /NCGR_PEP_ID=MMETSP0010_2-20120614/9967_1 /TAXON_ID=216773 ORGANISM="Corethron hystrix, Strain 308" /NCGR_SAMPLE_ID=MMETSP0010_2 /ASSEMBLY_ACC=CAM_ASM_000155 /LENGTH=276 /DNA_ID=CAMNT_0000169661 /DNA_START=22 /DNA_END=856 /DNA_ORIENTATION=+ /assembly_acc=CAM_ASM_000155
MLYIIGLGLGNEKDITVRGLEAVKSCSKLFLEAYTSILCVDKERLEAFYEKEITIADRNMVESEAEQIYQAAKDENVGLLVVGDPVCATTHTDIMLRALDYDVKVEMIHNASVMGALEVVDYSCIILGKPFRFPFFEGTWRPNSFYPKIGYNRKGSMHTLCLLDIKVKEPDFDAMMKGVEKFLPPRFMTINTAIEQLLEVEDSLEKKIYSRSTLCVGLARLGQPDCTIVSGTMEELINVDFGPPLHSLVICSDDVHELEMEMLQKLMVNESTKKIE